MANEARDAVINEMVNALGRYATTFELHRAIYDAGYDAHESAIRTAAEALVGVMEKLFNNEDGIIYGEDDIKAEFDALKAALATGKDATGPSQT